MSPAKDDARFDGDGTQSGLQPLTFSDAVSGSVSDDEGYQPLKVAKPVEPDPEKVRQMIEAMADKPLAPVEVPSDDLPPAAPAPAVPPAPPLGILPRQRTWRGRPKLGSWSRPSLRLPRPGQNGGTVRRAKPSSGSAAFLVAVVLIVVFGVLAIQFLASLIDTLTGIFD
ncbi:hypothetical protein GCM10027445_54190 [Amycolatopsis endophytica]|uniref:Uncharacterized protein n=1 Tax=Amycolatopsis endophytica TaxID=860233 RepID=A0A853B2Z4_9PSEU|nr:hypothetical protein [Amycolatopsis endophytica]NYI89006.1 hypothetical protein [Amycolatopsis endophytica]